MGHDEFLDLLRKHAEAHLLYIEDNDTDLFDWNIGWGKRPVEPTEEPVKTEPAKCVCGSKSIGIKDYSEGHAHWCEVHHDKTK